MPVVPTASYSFNIYALPPLFTAAAALLLGLATVVHERRSRVSWLFLCLTLSVAVWLLAIAGLFSTSDAAEARAWVKLEHVGVFLIPAAVYHFAVAVLGTERQRRYTVALAWLLSALFISGALISDQLIGGVYRYAWGFYPRYTWRNVPFLMFFAAMLLVSLLHYWTASRAAAPGSLQRHRTQALMVAFAVGYLGSVDYVAAYGVPLYPLGYLPVLAFLALIARAVWRYRLVDITPAFAAAQILETMHDAVLVLDQDGVVRLANRAASELLGNGGALAGANPPFSLEPLMARDQFAGLMRGDPLRRYELTYASPGNPGDVRTLSLSASPMPGPAGRPLAVVCVLRDVTEGKLAEERIRREAARSAALLHIAERLNTQLDLPSVLQAVSEETALALNTAIASVSLYDAASDALVYASAYGIPPELVAAIEPLPRARHEAGLRRLGPVIVVPDVQGLEASPNPRVYAALDVRSVAAATMMRESELVGTLSIATTGHVRQFSADDLSLLQGLAHQAAQAVANARLYTQASRRLSHLQALRRIDVAIASSPDLRQSLPVLLEQILEQLALDAASVLLLETETSTLDFAAGLGFRSQALQHTRLPLGAGHAGRAVQERRILPIADLRQNPDAFSRAPLLAAEEFVAYYAAPLIASEQVVGVLELFHRSPLQPNAEWLELMATLAGQAAITLDNARLFRDLQRSNADLTQAYDSTLVGWSRALDLRDRETEGHTQRVMELTVFLAQALGLAAAELTHIRRGALLHDIGKMGIPDSILLKPGPLTDDEWVIMRRHPGYARDMLASIDYLRPALDIPYAHHERWDGTGYPRGLQAEDIPWPARLFAVVDVWDALCADRPYRSAWPRERVEAYLREQSGRQFDPQMVTAFLQLSTSAPPLHKPAPA